MLRQISGIDVEIIFQKRKTLVLQIANNKVIIKANPKISFSVIERFVTDKKAWIEKKLTLSASLQQRFAQILNKQAFILHGENIEGAPKKGFYKKYAKKYLYDRLQELSLFTRLPFTAFSLSNAKKRWGSCTIKKEIRLNTRLVLLPKSLSDYVIIHELCHTKHLNHSKNFWLQVENLYPNYKRAKKELKEWGVLLAISLQ